MGPQRGLPVHAPFPIPGYAWLKGKREQGTCSLVRNKSIRYVDHRAGGINVSRDKNSCVLTSCNKETKTGMCACGDAKRGKMPDMDVQVRNAQQNPRCLKMRSVAKGKR